MKVSREEWDALNAKVAALETAANQRRDETLMRTPTGPMLVSVVVPMILRHLGLHVEHGYAYLLPGLGRASSAAAEGK